MKRRSTGRKATGAKKAAKPSKSARAKSGRPAKDAKSKRPAARRKPTKARTKARPRKVAHPATAPPQVPADAMLMQMATGAWVSRAIGTVTQLDVPDLLKAHGPSTARELAHERGLDAHPEFLERTMRACASVGVFTEDPEGRFGLTPISELLTADSPASRKKLVQMLGSSMDRIWMGLTDAVREGKPQAMAQLGLEFWDFLKANPKDMEDFGEAMKSNSLNSIRGLLKKCDLSGARKVVDVAGGFGHLAVSLLERHAHLNAVVLDMPELIPVAQRQWGDLDTAVSDRLEFIGGDMFESVPPADTYIMKHIIHDWDDDSCVRLLRNCAEAMEGNGRVICVDAVVPAMGDTGGTQAKFLDLNMMVCITGKERTLKQWESLYEAAGLRTPSVTPLDAEFGVCMLEGKKK